MSEESNSIRYTLYVFSRMLPCILLFSLLLSGCAGIREDTASGTGVYFDTVVDIKVYGEDADRLLSGCFDICESMEKTFSAHNEDSELYKVNHRDRSRTKIEVSDELAQCISEGLYYSEVSDGAFDITILPLTDIWDFKSESPEVPSDDEIKEAVAKVDYRRVRCDGNFLCFEDPDTMIDLGGIAKGYVSARLKEYLKEEGCTSAIINLGGNVSTIGSKPDGSDWVVGIQEPYADRGTVFETVNISEKAVVSSGTYERYFTAGGREYHHILDPETGYPADTGLFQASVVGEDDVLCDALSTICILLGEDASEGLIKKEGWDVDVLFIDTGKEGRWYGDEP